MALVEDTLIYPTIVELAACLCLELEAAGGPPLCYCGPVAGELALDFCGGSCDGDGCGGQAWVRFDSAFPSIAFPAPDGALLGNCRSPLAFSLEIGVARCAPQGTNSGVNGYTPPTMEEYVEAIRLQLSDVAAMRRAVQCCFGKNDRDYILGSYDQLTVSSGGCLGGLFSVAVWESF
jgi:hypothetical protein